MTRIGPFGKVAERFASQQETRFSVRFPQAFITILFQAFQNVDRSPPSTDKILPSKALLLQRGQAPFPHPLFKAVLLQTSKSSEPVIEPAFIELEGKRNNHYNGRGYTQGDRWFIKGFPTLILREWFPKRFERKCFP
ncbi:hypothetical protein AVEN_120338-1 [Araneus ventricosus]|uniref:Uncharacterized protein n=1 Tax=Araneus ventricosus TaxID=182803 RepID=A0A4Y2J7X0_ARAVE|nr:hypothetical protein AVEN_44291-1 [Araneus ventricosus]GBM86034.1 hypothetical protein AVEN_53868-1 [Araneus ventricosus]GBM86048.1 hypothetical protein AVEN_75397-1 [Araneus ventricosus]GBM86061.1 hypothetical protein AVEN_120338-1 [Araneus ventricosus]